MPDDTPSHDMEGLARFAAFNIFPYWLAPDAVPNEVILANAHPMNQGVDAECARITGKNGEGLFLKIMSADQRQWLDFENSVEMAKKAGDKGLSPQLIASDAARQAYLFDCLGESWRPAITLNMRAKDVCSGILMATKALHGLDRLGRNYSVFERIAELRQHMATGTRHVVTGTLNKVAPPENYREMCAVTDRIGYAFATMSSDLAPCHVENSLSNFMLGPSGTVQIVDFDRAANDDPLSDVGALCNEYCRTDNDIAQAVEIYSDRCDSQTFARVKLHMILAAFYWGMWGKVSHSASCRPEIEYYKYGENQFIRCAWHISNWDVDQLIREM